MAKAAAKKRSASTSRSKSSSSSSRSKATSGRKSQASPTSRSSNSSRSATKSPTSRSAGRSRSSNQEQSGQLLEKFFLDELKDLYSAEKQLLKGLSKMSKNATTEELKDAFENHRAQTEGHVERLDQVFEMLGVRAQAKKCEAMAGLIKEVESVLEDTEDDTMTRDVALIMGAQKAEHYEIASYGGLAQLARTMGRDDIAELLAETLEEEKQTDELLTQIAENNINMQAEEEGEEGESSEEEDEETEEDMSDDETDDTDDEEEEEE